MEFETGVPVANTTPFREIDLSGIAADGRRVYEAPLIDFFGVTPYVFLNTLMK